MRPRLCTEQQKFSATLRWSRERNPDELTEFDLGARRRRSEPEHPSKKLYTTRDNHKPKHREMSFADRDPASLFNNPKNFNTAKMPQQPLDPQEPPPRRLKACRTCRRQKMRCDGNPNNPCPRCVNAGVQCIFDLAEKRDIADSASGGAQKRKIDALEEELRLMKSQMRQIAQSAQRNRYDPIFETPQPESSGLNRDIGQPAVPLSERRDYPETPTGRELPEGRSVGPNDNDSRHDSGDVRNMPEDSGFWNESVLLQDAEDTRCIHHITLNAPLSAVHAMTPPDSAASSDRARGGGPHPRSDAACGATSPSIPFQGVPSGIGLSASSGDGDFISRLFQDRPNHRVTRYFAGANPFLPMFDPLADTFDSLRRRSPFCLITVLFIALSQTQASIADIPRRTLEKLRDAAWQESLRLAAESLFQSTPTVESVQAMILLAAYSEKSWFALGHALQMASALGLDKAVGQLIKGIPEATLDAHELIRQARTWFILHHIERELAFGTAHQPRMPHIDDSLREYLDVSLTTSSDIRYISIIELVQLRGGFLAEIDSLSLATASPVEWVDDAERRIRDCSRYWDRELTGAIPSPRTSLSIQKAFTTLNVYGHVLCKVRQGSEPESRTDEEELMRRTAKLSMDLLQFIGNSSSYQWHFQCAPSYSALMLTFLAMFSFQISRQYPNLIDKTELKTSLGPVAAMLDNYPYTSNLSNLIQQISRSLQGKVISTELCPGGAAGGLTFDEAAIHADQSEEVSGFTFEGIEAFLAPNYFGDCFTFGWEAR
ncbi:hypothetical protein FDECE_14330 [Fusarium decemcellulare]|nr:hypothetical protein FDECE_14330 [Fusarium decemcellulare]